MDENKTYRDPSLTHLLKTSQQDTPPIGMEDRIMAAIESESKVASKIKKNIRLAWVSTLSTAASMLMLLLFKSDISTVMTQAFNLEGTGFSSSMVIMVSAVFLGILFFEIDPLIGFMMKRRFGFTAEAGRRQGIRQGRRSKS